MEKKNLKCSLTLTSDKKDCNKVNINLNFKPSLKNFGEGAPEVHHLGVLLFHTVVLYTSNPDFHDDLTGLLERYQRKSPEPHVLPEAANE